jgi:hypothetical protein
MTHAELLLSVAGQSLTYDPPEPFRPSGTPTVTVYAGQADDGTATVSATTGAASVDSVNTTTTAAAYVGDTSIAVTSATSITRGKRLLLTDTDTGEFQWNEVMGVATLTVTLRYPLTSDFASGATVQGTRISISVDDTWAATAANLTDALGDPDDIRFSSSSADIAPGAAGYRVRWSYTVNSIATLGVSYFDLVRYHGKSLVTPLDVDRTFPGWIDRLPPDYRADQGLGLIEEAFRAVKMDALTDSQLVRRIRDTQVLGELVRYRANLLAMQADVFAGRRDVTALTVAQDAYDKRYVQLLREPKVSVDQTGGGSHGEAIRLPAFRR